MVGNIAKNDFTSTFSTEHDLGNRATLTSKVVLSANVPPKDVPNLEATPVVMSQLATHQIDETLRRHHNGQAAEPKTIVRRCAEALPERETKQSPKREDRVTPHGHAFTVTSTRRWKEGRGAGGGAWRRVLVRSTTDGGVVTKTSPILADVCARCWRLTRAPEKTTEPTSSFKKHEFENVNPLPLSASASTNFAMLLGRVVQQLERLQRRCAHDASKRTQLSKTFPHLALCFGAMISRGGGCCSASIFSKPAF